MHLGPVVAVAACTLGRWCDERTQRPPKIPGLRGGPQGEDAQCRQTAGVADDGDHSEPPQFPMKNEVVIAVGCSIKKKDVRTSRLRRDSREGSAGVCSHRCEPAGNG